MKRMMMVAAIVMAVVVAGSVAWAWDWDDHVKVAPNAKGDTLIFPFYFVSGGWESKIWVINTAMDRSVVAKVVIRSRINSSELRDFFLFLTPRDAWNGTIRIGANGQPEIYSADDSCLASRGVFATTANPFIVDIPAPPCADDTNTMGYIEVFTSVHSTAVGIGDPDGSGPLGNVSLNAPPVPKLALYNAYNLIAPFGSDRLSTRVGGDNNLVTDGINVLTGFMEFKNSAQNQNAVVPAKILRDYDGTLFQGKLAGVDTVSPGHPLTLVNETWLGEESGETHNSVGEIEAALSANNLAMPYSNSTLTAHIITFPTKKVKVGTGTTMCTTGRTVLSPYFKQHSNSASGWCVSYTASMINMSEEVKVGGGIVSPFGAASSFCGEVNFVTSFPYTEGWANYAFAGPTMGATQPGLPISAANITKFDQMSLLGGDDAAGTPLVPEGDYTGTPAIGVTLNLASTNDGYWMLPAAYSDGMVRDIVNLTGGNPTIYHYYQYQDESNTGFLYDIDMTAPTSAGTEYQGRGLADGHRPLN